MAFKTYAPTKAQMMRAAAAKMQERGEKPTPKAVTEELAKKGVTVSSGHASIVIRKFNGKRLRSRSRLVARNPAAKVSTNVCDKNNHDPLLTAIQFVKDCGGFKQARIRLSVMESFIGSVS